MLDSIGQDLWETLPGADSDERREGDRDKSRMIIGSNEEQGEGFRMGNTCMPVVDSF